MTGKDACNSGMHWDGNGMTLRQYYAGLALMGMLSANAKCSPEVCDRNVDQVLAREAVASADALIAELEK